MSNLLADATIIAPFLNLLNTGLNLYWMIKLKAIQGKREMLSEVIKESEAKDEVIKSLQLQLQNAINKKNLYKHKYQEYYQKDTANQAQGRFNLVQQ